MTIGLNFIMKNESKVLLRMLASVDPIVDGCVCVDTGSTDESKKIVKDFFESKGKPCEIYDYTLPFNFGDARQFALTKAGTKYDFNFWIDCDEELKLNSAFSYSNLYDQLSLGDYSRVAVTHNERNSTRIQFWKTNKPFYWTLPYHESLACDIGVTATDINSNILHIVSYPEGDSYSNHNKHRKAAKMLLDYIKKHGEDPRCVHYVANEYGNANMLEKSLEWHRKRVKMTNGDINERYWSQHMIGCLVANLKRPVSEVMNEFLLCSELNPHRIDHIIKLIIILQEKHRYNAAYVYSTYAMDNLYRNESRENIQLYNLHKANCNKLNKENKFNDIEKLIVA